MPPENDVELPPDVSWAPDAPCLLTGGPGELRSVKLRRMIFLLVTWGGEDATVPLPLSAPLALAPWQVLRMLRPAFGLALAFPLVLAAEARGASGVARLGIAAAGVLLVWLPLEWLLRRFEPIRLVHVSSDRRRLTLRFASPAAAARARGSMQG